MSNDIETLRGFIAESARAGQMDGTKAVAALERLEAGQAAEGYRQFCAMRRRAEKAEAERDALRAKLENAEDERDRLRRKFIKTVDWLSLIVEMDQEHSSIDGWHDGESAKRARAALAELSADDAPAQPPQKFPLGSRVEKIKGSSWRGRVVGFYSTELTPDGYCVESERERGSVQIYPESALRAVADAPARPAAALEVMGREQ